MKWHSMNIKKKKKKKKIAGLIAVTIIAYGGYDLLCDTQSAVRRPSSSGDSQVSKKVATVNCGEWTVMKSVGCEEWVRYYLPQIATNER